MDFSWLMLLLLSVHVFVYMLNEETILQGYGNTPVELFLEQDIVHLISQRP